MAISHVDFIRMCRDYAREQQVRDVMDPQRVDIYPLFQRALESVSDQISHSVVRDTPVNRAKIELIGHVMKKHMISHCDPRFQEDASRLVDNVLSEVEQRQARGGSVRLRDFIEYFYRPFVPLNPWGLLVDPLQTIEEIADENDPRIEITLSMHTIDDIYQRTGMLQLRAIPAEATSLVIGCGNAGLIGGGYEDLRRVIEKAYHDNNHENLIDYSNYVRAHRHEREVTFSPDLLNNSTILGRFNHHFLRQILPDHRFDSICFEGYFPVTPISREHCADLCHLLTEGGRIYFSGGGDHRQDITDFFRWGAAFGAIQEIASNSGDLEFRSLVEELSD